MSVLGSMRENWRIVMLVLFIVLSGVALFVPFGDAGASTPANASAANASGPTNLEYGLELSGGTKIRAPMVGITAEQVELGDRNATELRVLQQSLADRLGVAGLDVEIRTYQGQQPATIEVFSENVSKDQLRQALDAEGVGYGEVRDGVTDTTLDRSVEVLNRKVNEVGLSGGNVYVSRSATGDEAFVVVEVPGQQPEEVLDLIRNRGTVLIVAHFPTENGSQYRDVTLLTQEDIDPSTVQQNTQPGRSGYSVPITITDQAAAQNFSNSMQKFGFTREGAESCRYQRTPDDAGYCLYTVSNGRVVDGRLVEGEVVSAASMTTGLAGTIESGNFVRDPSFEITSPTQEQARRLELNLRAGGLPTRLDIDAGTISFTTAELGSQFKLFSLVTGVFAVLAVAGSIFVRYRRPEVALPMLLTASAEVFILLGFAAAVGLALDLSHIAGFIAVIGTGVDDLVIIADEIMQGGDVKTGKVFRSRFRKAFWVIGAAAATTIVAMSPLAVLSLGDLQGFAIVTIVGVLIGVLVTRPAYGDILRNLVLD